VSSIIITTIIIIFTIIITITCESGGEVLSSASSMQEIRPRRLGAA